MKKYISILLSLFFICLQINLSADAAVFVSGSNSIMMDVIYTDAEESLKPETPALTNQPNGEISNLSNPDKLIIPKIGDTIYFGHREQAQGPDKNSKQIEWQVLNIINDKQMLLYNKTIPDSLQVYDGYMKPDESEREKILTWLNTEYIDKSFNVQERECLEGRLKINLLSDYLFESFEEAGQFTEAGINTDQWYLHPLIRLDIAEWASLPTTYDDTRVEEPRYTSTPEVLSTEAFISPTDVEISVIISPEMPQKTPIVPDRKTDDHPFNSILLLLLCVTITAAGVFVFMISREEKNKKFRPGYNRKNDRQFDFSEDSNTIDSETLFLGKTSAYYCSGCKGQGKRDYQEDNLWYSRSTGPGLPVCAVLSDGMGGMDNGAESSALAIDVFKAKALNIRTDQDIPSRLWQISNEANQAVYQRNSEKGMNGGSTLVCVFITGNMLYWLSIGDSRIFLYRNGMLASVNEEHELETRMYKKFIEDDIDLVEIRETHRKELRKLTSNLGRSSIPLIDQNFIPYMLKKDDKLLLCSDGVSDTLTEQEILFCLKDPDPDVNCDRISEMIEAKNKRGQDNYSAIVISVRTENGR